MTRILSLFGAVRSRQISPAELADDIRGWIAVGVLFLGVACTAALPFVLGWWLLEVVGIR